MPMQRPAVVDHRHPRQLVAAQGLHDGLDIVLGADRHRVGVHDVADAQHGRERYRANGSASTTSRASTPSTPRRSAAWRPARACRRTAAHAAANGSTPRASNAAIDAAEHVAGPGRRQRRASRRGLTATTPSGRGDQRVVALEHDDRARAARGLADVVQAPRLDGARTPRRAGGRARPRAASGRSAPARAASASGSPANAFRPSASSSTGGSAPATIARTKARRRRCARRPARRRARRRARSSSSTVGGARLGVRAVGVREPARHRLQQADLEDRLQAGGHARRDVARAACAARPR